MKKVTAILGFVLALGVAGQAAAQVQLTSVGTNYGSSTVKIIPIDKEQWIGSQEIMGVRLEESGKGPLHLVSSYITMIMMGDKNGVRLHGYSTFVDKDGDKLMAELWEASLTQPRGKGKVIGGTGKFAGAQGTCEYEVSNPVGFPEGTSRTVCREVWKLTLKAPL